MYNDGLFDFIKKKIAEATPCVLPLPERIWFSLKSKCYFKRFLHVMSTIFNAICVSNSNHTT